MRLSAKNWEVCADCVETQTKTFTAQDTACPGKLSAIKLICIVTTIFLRVTPCSLYTDMSDRGPCCLQLQHTKWTHSNVVRLFSLYNKYGITLGANRLTVRIYLLKRKPLELWLVKNC